MAAKLDVSWDVEMKGKDDEEDHHEPFFMLDHLDRPFWKWMAARYDPDMEDEVLGWIKELTGEDIPGGQREVERALRSGVVLVKLVATIQQGTPNCPVNAAKMKLKPNMQQTTFKQLENIDNFVTFCLHYGVPQISTFQPPDLYEGKNMGMVLVCIQTLGTEAQRNGFIGRTIGSKPVEKNFRYFTEEQMRASHSIIGLQAGYNKGATQKGMSIGGTRHIADIKADEITKEGQAIISLQAGFNRGANQTGMVFGGVRHVSDIRADQMCADGNTIIGLQMGTNKLASQSGMVIGGIRHVSDIRADDMVQDGKSFIGLQYGSNKGASQSGMVIGGVRHISDIRADDMVQDGKSVIGLQSGSNKGASQSGMVFGGVRHISDIRADDMSREGKFVIGPQYGSYRGANQSGMQFGGMRHAGDLRPDVAMTSRGAGAIGLQMGQNKGASQSGMIFGSVRHDGDLKVSDYNNPYSACIYQY